jgi:two-component system, cell cycle sensor histidine kinase and response regulator CckA
MFESALDAFPSPVALLDGRGTIVFVNRSWRAAAGASAFCAPAHHVGTDYAASLAGAGEEARPVAMAVRRVLTGEAPSLDTHFAEPDGSSRRWFRLRLTPFAAEPRPLLLLSHEEITDLRRAGEPQQPGKSQLWRILSQLPGILWTTDRELRVTSCAGAHMVGKAADEVLGRSLDQVFRTGDEESTPIVMHRLALQGRPGSYEVVWNGIPMDWRTEPLRDDAGQIVGVIGIAHDISERRAAEQRLRESEERFRLLAESVPQVFWLSDAETGRVIYVSPAAEAVWGIPAEQFYHDMEPAYAAVHPDDREWVREQFARIRGNLSEQVEFRVVRQDGSVRWLSARGFTVTGGSGRRTVLAGITEDITERKHAALEIERRRVFLRAVIDASPSGVFVKDPEGRFTLVNPATARFYRHSPEQLLGKTDEELGYPAAVVSEFRRTDRLAIEQGRMVLVPATLFVSPQTGEARWVETRKVPLHLPGQAAPSVLCVATDVTEHIEAELALRASEERYRRFFEDDLTADFIAAPDGRVVECNAAFALMFGFASAEEVRHANLADLYADPSEWSAILATLRAKRRIERHEQAFFRPDGRTVFTILNTIGEFDARGALTSLRGYLFDITDRKVLEDQLRHAQKMEAVGRLAGGIAHDFNNLLTVILGNVEMLLSWGQEMGSSREELEEVQHAARRAASLTSQLLAFGRRQALHPEVIDINQHILQLHGMLRRLVPPSIDIQTWLDSTSAQVRVDPGQLDQVLINLVVNACDSMPGGGELAISTADRVVTQEDHLQRPLLRPGRYLVIGVQDTGSGIAAEVLPHIFEPFFTTKDQGKGTGLGLSTVYGIIDQSGGFVGVDSEVGCGTTFEIFLPQIEAGGAEPHPAAAPQPQSRGRETVLLVEDEEQVRKLTRRILERLGYTVVEAEDGEAALRVYAEAAAPIDLLLTDVMMPRMGGNDLVASLREDHPSLKVVYMSGYPGDALSQPGSATRDSVFVQKPFTPEALAHAVRGLLDEER